MTGGGGPPRKGPGELRPAPSDGADGNKLGSLGGPRESVLKTGRLADGCSSNGGPVRPGGGTTALA